jgi:prophage maintenance system killer protein
MGKKKGLRLNLDRIVESLSEVQRDWDELNRNLLVHRENLTDEIIQNMVSAYHYLDNLIADRAKIFDQDGLHHLLELNHIVLCGKDPLVRLEYGHHLVETRKKFYENVKPLHKWYKKNHDSSPLKVAAEVYVGVLSRPQLFIEGNHRTGALIASYILLRKERYPFVLNVKNAEAYFNPSSRIKFSDKRSIKGKLKLPRYEKEFKKFLEENISGDYVLDPG